MRQLRPRPHVQVLAAGFAVVLASTLVSSSSCDVCSSTPEERAALQLRQLRDALDIYRLAHHRYPTTEEGLDGLIRREANAKPIIDQLPVDPWGHSFGYTWATTGFHVWSNGPDGRPATHDDISVIHSVTFNPNLL